MTLAWSVFTQFGSFDSILLLKLALSRKLYASNVTGEITLRIVLSASQQPESRPDMLSSNENPPVTTTADWHNRELIEVHLVSWHKCTIFKLSFALMFLGWYNAMFSFNSLHECAKLRWGSVFMTPTLLDMMDGDYIMRRPKNIIRPTHFPSELNHFWITGH